MSLALLQQEGGGVLWAKLNPRTASLSRIFSPLWNAAEGYDRPWSIAELCLSGDDVDWLLSWLQSAPTSKVEEWIRWPVAQGSDHKQPVAERTMFGSLLISATAEVCRRSGTESSVWPMVRRVIPQSSESDCRLFLSDGQPAAVLRDAISEAVEFLGLRNVMDTEGTQQWFDTIKLQFGFTFRGASSHLSKWLVGLGKPVAVQCLLETEDRQKLGSQSFRSLWNALVQHRRGLVDLDRVKGVLEQSPWVLDEWIDDLLVEARARLDTLGTGDWMPSADAPHARQTHEDVCPVQEVSLRWAPGEHPRISIALSEDSLSDALEVCDSTAVDFFVDGHRAARWLRQADGTWSGSRAVFAEPDGEDTPNLTPQTLSVESRNGEVICEWDLADSGLADDVLLFDSASGRMLKLGFVRLDPRREYALLCDRKCDVTGVAQADVYERNGVPKKAVRVAAPVSEDICVSYKDFVLWQPAAESAGAADLVSLSLRTQNDAPIELLGKAKLAVEGLPEGATDVKLLVHRKTHALVPVGDQWETAKHVVVTPELAAGRRRVCVGFGAEGRRYSRRPRLDLRIQGAAMLRQSRETEQEGYAIDALLPGSELNKSERTSFVRVWVPERDSDVSLYEGTCRIGKLRNARARLRSLPGHGGMLAAATKETRYELGIACVDTGCVRGFIQPMLGCDAQLLLLSEIDPDEIGPEGFAVHAWIRGKKGKAVLSRVPAENLLPESRRRSWSLRDLRDPMAVAISWRGVWQGAWWDLEMICRFLGNIHELSSRELATLKWLRVPILHPAIAPSLRQAVRGAPRRFLEVWLGDSGLPEGLHPRGFMEGAESVVRCLYWNDYCASRDSRVISWASARQGSQSDDYSPILDWAYTLQALCEISPVLLRQGIEMLREKRRDWVQDVLQVLVGRTLGLPLDARAQHIRGRLAGLQEQISERTTLSLERVKELVFEHLQQLRERRGRPLDEYRDDMMEIAETRAGRRLLTAICSLYSTEEGLGVLDTFYGGYWQEWKTGR